MTESSELPVLIVGTTAAGRAAAAALQLKGRFIYGYLTLDANENRAEIDDLPILGQTNHPELQAIFTDGKTDYWVAVTDASLRLSLMRELLGLSKKLPLCVVHPTAWVDESADLAAGSLIGPGCLVGAGSKLEACCHLGLGVAIDAEVTLGSACTLGAGVVIGSGAHVGNHVFIGAGAVVGAGVRVGDGATIAPGAVVLRNADAGSQLVGNPAQPL
jgi:sugar O-acyltransferase (sialic acid O-acetyltransferase NeuD family)